MNDPLKNVVKIGTCEAGMCNGLAIAEVSLDVLRFDAETLEARAIVKQVKVCFKHKSWYFKYQEGLLDRINPERKKNRNGGKPGPGQSNVAYSKSFGKRFRSLR